MFAPKMKRLIFLLFSIFESDCVQWSPYVSNNTSEASSTITPLDCGWLSDNDTKLVFAIISTKTKVPYIGQCCTSAAVATLDEENPKWRQTTDPAIKQNYINNLAKSGNCTESSTTALEDTATPFDCDWLADTLTVCDGVMMITCVGANYSYDGDCCNSMAVSTLNKKYPDWRNVSSLQSQSKYIIYLNTMGSCYETTTEVTITTTTSTKTPSTPKTSKKRTSTPPKTTSTELTTTTHSTMTTSAQNDTTPTPSSTTKKTKKKSTASSTNTQSTESSEQTTKTTNETSTSQTSTDEATTSSMSSTANNTDFSTTSINETSTTFSSTTDTTDDYIDVGNFSTQNTSSESTSSPSSVASSSPISSPDTISSSNDSTTDNNTTVEPTDSLDSTESSTSKSSAETTTEYPWPTGGTTRTLPDGEIILNESLESFPNCTTILRQLIYNPQTNTTRTNETTDPEGCKSSSTSKTTVGTSKTSSSLKTNTSTSTSTTTDSPTTTYVWPTGGTTVTLPGGLIVLNERVQQLANCTLVMTQQIYDPKTGSITYNITSSPQECKSTSSKSASSVTAKSSISTQSLAAGATATTTYVWPTGGTTRTLANGLIVLNERIQQLANCTVIFTQQLYDPNTGDVTYNTTSDPQGCKLLNSTTISATTPMSTPIPAPTTTYNWPTAGTTKTLSSGLIVLNERIQQLENCTVILTQQLYNPNTGEITYNTTSDPQGCKTLNSSTVSATTPVSTATTTYNWPTGGTTKTLSSGLIVLNERIQQLANCTVILTQQLYNPTTGEITYNTTSDPQGCKTLNSSTVSSISTTTPIPEATTTYVWPTAGTTKTLPSGLIILNERIQQLANCTVILTQQLYNPTTGAITYNTTSDPQGCKLLNSTTVPSISATTPMPEATTTYIWPTGGTTKTLPGGLIVLNEKIQQLANCTVILTQQLYNPTTGAITYNSTSDPQGCKTMNLTTASSLVATSSPGTVETTVFNWPTSGTTKTLPSGLIVLSEKLVAYDNCTTVLYQLLYNITSKEQSSINTTDPEGCKATTSTVGNSAGQTSSSNKTSTTSPTTSSISCPALSIDLSYAILPTSSDLKQSYSSGDQIIHNCQADYVFSSNRTPLNIYICLGNGTWSGTPSTCIPDKEL